MADVNTPRVEFALGSEVSPGHFFKSTFARSFVTANCRDSKSLDYEFYGNATITEENADVPRSCANGVAAVSNGGGNGNFYSLVNFGAETDLPNSSVWSSGKASPGTVEAQTTELSELEKLRKQCHALTEENERLQASLRSQPAHVQVIDNVYLQNQVDTLQWQLKQSEANRQMYRSVMEQVMRFLERARKSLDIIHEKSSSKRHNTTFKEKSRVPRSRSVHAVHGEDNGSPSRRMTTSSSCASSTTSSGSSSSSSSSSSRFSRAKSVAQISPNCSSGTSGSGSTGGFRDFTWSMLRKDSSHCTPPRVKPPPPPVSQMSMSVQDMNKAQDNAIYRRPKQSEIDPDDVPPEKLSQEAFRLLRTVQSLLVMREPDLARLNTTQDAGISPPPLDHHPDISSLSLQSNFANSTTLQETTMATMSACSSSDRGTEGSGNCSTDDEVNRTTFVGKKKPIASSSKATLTTTTAMSSSQQAAMLMSPGARQSIDATSLNSTSSKNTEDEDVGSVTRSPNFAGLTKQESQQQHSGYHNMPAPTSTPNNRRIKKSDRKELHLKSLRDWALGNSSSSVTSRPKPATSVSSAEDESGFSSMSSFQEVGLPNVANLSPIKGGCHTEVGLPEVPLDKVRHRRWSSTPAEFQALFKRHSGSFASNGQTTAESLSVWV